MLDNLKIIHVAQALQSVLMYYGIQYRQGQLAKMTKADPQQGTSVNNIIKTIKQLNLIPIAKTNMTLKELQTYLNKKVPVIVLIQAWRQQDDQTPWISDWDDGHYVVAIGYDQKNIYFEDPSILGGIGYIPRSQFMERWHDIDTNPEQGGFIIYNQFGLSVQGKRQDIQTIVYIQ